MKVRHLGRTGIAVSEIALGAVELGMDYGIHAAGAASRPNEKDAAWMLNRALDLGVNFIDTARAYGDSEAIIGRALKRRRSEFTLATKVQAADSLNGSLKKAIRLSVERSLVALQTDIIDILQLHSAPLEVLRRGEAVEILKELQREGSIRFLGVTVYGQEAAMEAIQAGAYDCVQIAYNALDRESGQQVLAAAEERDIGIVVRSVLLKGALSYRYQHLPETLSELKSAVARVAAIADARSMSLPELAFRFVLRQPAVSTALVGASSVEELEAAIKFSSRGPLPDEIVAEIEAVTLSRPEQLYPGNWPIS